MEALVVLRTIALILMTFLLGSAIADHGIERGSQDVRVGVEQHCHNTWFFWNEMAHKCVCGPGLGSAVRCNQTTRQVWLHLTETMTHDNFSVQVGSFPFRVPVKPGEYALLPENLTELNNAMCGNVNREGLLCSKCKPGYGPAVLSYNHECVHCSRSGHGWLLYILFACVPTIVFFLLITLCQVRVTSASLSLYVISNQLFAANVTMFIQSSIPHYYAYSKGKKVIFGVFGTFFTSWNLDFFRLLLPPFCISESISNLQVLCMEYIVAFIPLILTVIMYVCIQQHARGNRVLICLWKPFEFCLTPLSRRYNWNPMESIVHAFASFLVLSSTKILFVSYNLLLYDWFHSVNMSNGNGSPTDSSRLVLYYDPTLTFFGKSHLPYALLAIFVSTTFVLLPTLVLILYPTRLFHKCLNCCGIRWHSLHAFADAFNGCYRNGSDGTCDCRCFAGFYLLFRIVYVISAATPSMSVSHSNLYKLIFIASLFLFTLVSPYKSRIYNIWDSSYLAIAAYYYAVGSQPRWLAEVLVYILSSSLFLFPWIVICVKIIFITDTRCSRWLRSHAEKMRTRSADIGSERNACDEENDLPDRLVNSGNYRMLNGENSCEELNRINTVDVPTYGIV